MIVMVPYRLVMVADSRTTQSAYSSPLVRIRPNTNYRRCAVQGCRTSVCLDVRNSAPIPVIIGKITCLRTIPASFFTQSLLTITECSSHFKRSVLHHYPHRTIRWNYCGVKQESVIRYRFKPQFETKNSLIRIIYAEVALLRYSPLVVF